MLIVGIASIMGARFGGCGGACTAAWGNTRNTHTHQQIS
ncbi:MAG: hypothetical protein QOH50_4566 [Kribbellaceae bacterium]|jgi:hypothetical protein|nr:hypothetical protein [Kribbellaceae bacterium]